MPEVWPVNKSTIRGIEKKLISSGSKIPTDFTDLGLEQLGETVRQNIVFVHPRDREKVIALSLFPIEQNRARFIYHNHNILSTLFPHNFPRIFAAFGRDEDGAGAYAPGTVRARKKGRQLNTPDDYYVYDYKIGEDKLTNFIKRGARNELDVRYPFNDAIEIVRSLGADPFIDVLAQNFLVGEDGGEYYLDIVDKNLTDFNKLKTIKYMANNGYSQQEIHSVSSSIDRIVHLRADLGPDFLDPMEEIRRAILGY